MRQSKTVKSLVRARMSRVVVDVPTEDVEGVRYRLMKRGWNAFSEELSGAIRQGGKVLNVNFTVLKHLPSLVSRDSVDLGVLCPLIGPLKPFPNILDGWNLKVWRRKRRLPFCKYVLRGNRLFVHADSIFFVVPGRMDDWIKIERRYLRLAGPVGVGTA
jgi:hypothetical protein